MTVRYFIDTNVLTYAHLTNEREKHEIALAFLRDKMVGSSIWVSTQILSEFYSSMSKNKYAHDKIVEFISPMIHSMNVLPVTVETVEMALGIKAKYQISYWDALMLSAALESNSEIVYTEDLQHNQVIERRLTIVNPFVNVPEKSHEIVANPVNNGRI